MSKTEPGGYAFPEILNQPQAWEETINLTVSQVDELRAIEAGVDNVIFTGCGSALNVAWAAAPVFQQFTGIQARAVSAADCIYFPETVFVEYGRTLFVAVSRSGDTTETVMACEAARHRGAKTIAITCYTESKLAQMADIALVLEAANEKAVVTTQSLTSMVLCGQVLTALVSGKGSYLDALKSLPELGAVVLERYHDLGRELAQNRDIARFSFVGNGAYYGLARECQLKIKEMTLLPVDSYPVLEFRHGPKSNVNEHMLVTLLLSDAARGPEIAFLEEMKALGGHTLVLCDKAGAEISSNTDYVVELGMDLPDFVRDILYMPPVHFLAYYRSLIEGQNPDCPANLDYAVILEDSD